MPRFPAFRRKSTVDLDNEAATPSFRVLDRLEVANGRSFDGGASLSAKTQRPPKTSLEDAVGAENIFADLRPKQTNRVSGSSKNTSDNSSRHSNTSTAPSSTDITGQDEWKTPLRKPYGDVSVPPVPKSGPGAFIKNSSRSWSFGGSKKPLPTTPANELKSTPTSPIGNEVTHSDYVASNAAHSPLPAEPSPAKMDNDFSLDLGGNFSSMMFGFDKRSSGATVTDENGKRLSRPLSGLLGRGKQPDPIKVDGAPPTEPSPFSFRSRGSRENLLSSTQAISPAPFERPPPVPRHGSTSPGRSLTNRTPSSENLLKRTSALFGRQKDDSPVEDDDEETRMLKESISAVHSFMATNKPKTSQGRYRRDEPTLRDPPWNESSATAIETKSEDDNLFENVRLDTARAVRAAAPRDEALSAPARVMTPAQFERFRKEKDFEARQSMHMRTPSNDQDSDEEDEPNYDDEDEEEDAERTRQAAKQRQKQEAHMSVYRQQMMKVTGEAANGLAARPSVRLSLSVPNLNGEFSKNSSSAEGSDEDEEVPLAILAAHGFPNKNKPPAQLGSTGANPALRQVTQPSYQRPGSVVEGSVAGGGRRLPPFARNLPQDPYGLVNPSVRESFALGGGMPANPGGALPPGGLIGVIAGEERSRALRRGSPQIPGMDGVSAMGPAGFDQSYGMSPQMMYPYGMQDPGQMMQDSAQMQQQMQQFMQMQMQFMQMMAANNGSQSPRSAHGASQSMAMPPMGLGMNMDMNGSRASFYEQPGGSTPDFTAHSRTASMAPSASAPWVQRGPPLTHQTRKFAPSVRAPAPGYTPSIAPSERSNVGLPGRYRPVSQAADVPSPLDRTRGAVSAPLEHSRTASAASGRGTIRPVLQEPEEDEDEGWAAMKAKRDQRKSTWKTRKSVASPDLAALIN